MRRLPAEPRSGQAITSARCSIAERLSITTSMKTAVLIACILGSLGFGTAGAQDIEEFWFRPYDTLAQRDEYGLLHSSKQVNPTDTESRYHWRPFYYLEG